jgi:hypothetical protein
MVLGAVGALSDASPLADGVPVRRGWAKNLDISGKSPEKNVGVQRSIWIAQHPSIVCFLDCCGAAREKNLDLMRRFLLRVIE